MPLFGTETFAEWLPWILVVAGALAVAYERIVGRGVWRNVADGRLQRISDLEAEQERLKQEIAELRGEVAGLYKVKADQIVEGVIVGLRPFLQHAEEA